MRKEQAKMLIAILLYGGTAPTSANYDMLLYKLIQYAKEDGAADNFIEWVWALSIPEGPDEMEAV